VPEEAVDQIYDEVVDRMLRADLPVDLEAWVRSALLKLLYRGPKRCEPGRRMRSLDGFAEPPDDPSGPPSDPDDWPLEADGVDSSLSIFYYSGGAALGVSASLGDLTKRQGFRNLQTDIRMGPMMIRHEDPGKVEISGQGQGAHFMLYIRGGPSPRISEYQDSDREFIMYVQTLLLTPEA